MIVIITSAILCRSASVAPSLGGSVGACRCGPLPLCSVWDARRSLLLSLVELMI